MNTLSAIAAALAAGAIAAPAGAETQMQPPMNDFYEAFYTCESGGAFLICCNSETPASATLTTSKNKKYQLKRGTPRPA